MISNLSFAGWYQVYCYNGQLAGVNIHMYLQLREINSETKDSIKVSGIYKYDKHNTPITLTGYIINQKFLILSELSEDNEPKATIRLDWSIQNELNGRWTDKKNGKSYNINMTKIGELIDTASDKINPPTRIMMGSSFKNEYLVVIYDKSKDDYRAKMIELLIIDKMSNKVKHKVDFRNNVVPVGNVMTVIFANAYAIESPNGKQKNIELMQDDGRMGTELYLTYNATTDKFEIDE